MEIKKKRKFSEGHASAYLLACSQTTSNSVRRALRCTFPLPPGLVPPPRGVLRGVQVGTCPTSTLLRCSVPLFIPHRCLSPLCRFACHVLQKRLVDSFCSGIRTICPTARPILKILTPTRACAYAAPLHYCSGVKSGDLLSGSAGVRRRSFGTTCSFYSLYFAVIAVIYDCFFL